MSRRPLRLLHTSDVHLGPATREPNGRPHAEHCICPIDVLAHLVDEHAIDVVLIVGDLFDHARIPGSLVEATFARLGEINAEVALITGNHDVFDETNLYRRHREIVDASGVVFFDELHGRTHDLAGGALRVWARAMAEHAPSFEPLLQAPAHPLDRWYVAAAHGHFTPPDGDPYRSSRITIEDIEATDADYVALGHWHVTTDLSTRGVTRPAWYSGAPLFGYAAGNILSIELTDGEPVVVRPIDVLDHHATRCPRP